MRAPTIPPRSIRTRLTAAASAIILSVSTACSASVDSTTANPTPQPSNPSQITDTVSPSSPPASDASASSSDELSKDLVAALRNLETRYDARIGVFAKEGLDGKSFAWRADERFAYASTYKALAAGALLDKFGTDILDTTVQIPEGDLVEYSPVTEQYAGQEMTVRQVAEAAVRTSDNTAGNILLELLGGPHGFDEELEHLGDTTTRADRFEPELNEATPGDPRDTSTPAALAQDLQAYVAGDELSTEERALLTKWMSANATGDTLVRAAVPEDWIVIDKSGAGRFATRNDIAIVTPPDEPPVTIAILTSRSAEDATRDDDLVVDTARLVLEELSD
ncbi:class A beta-lactamase [Arthrobacter frigidicola]|nr:class A beta-lactamase [Arthrobacter frigidicola]